MRRLLTPRWVALHVLAVVAVIVCLRFAAWQWGRAEASGRFQNYAYAVEWGVFALFAVFMWVKTMVDGVEDAAGAEHSAQVTPAPEAEQPAPRLGTPMQPRLGTPLHPRLGTPLQPRLGTPAQGSTVEPGQAEEEPDEELAAYNAYLAHLNAQLDAEPRS